MSLLKKHLAQTKMNSENAMQKSPLTETEISNSTVSTIPQVFVPGIIVRVSLEEPVVDIKGFKVRTFCGVIVFCSTGKK